MYFTEHGTELTISSDGVHRTTEGDESIEDLTSGHPESNNHERKFHLPA